jgi:hypothetical protein
MSVINDYLNKKNTTPVHLDFPPEDDLKYVVVIPCYDEKNMITTLESLLCAKPPKHSIEVLIIINSSTASPESVINQNKETYHQINRWTKKNKNEKIQFYPVYIDNLPEKNAGPGLARKIGMDTAIERFYHAEQEQGYILSLDADCTCEENYFLSVEEAILENKKLNAGILYYEHPLTGNQYHPSIYKAVASYELFLRYYNQGLAYCGFPYPFHTIGSIFFVKASAYAKQGGMNKRKAGEDFYFLNKIFQLGNIQEVNTTRVIPSPRPSDRVLFGTGPTVKNLTEKNLNEYKVYHPKYFEMLKDFFNHTISEIYNSDYTGVSKILNQIPNELNSFLTSVAFTKELKRLKSNCASEKTFRKQFFHWFNGLKVIQFMHFVHPNEEHKITVAEATEKLLSKMGMEIKTQDVFNLLNYYRNIEKSVAYKIN